MKTERDILKRLDDTLAETGFVLDNQNVDFVKGKLDVFVNGENWLIAIQIYQLSVVGPAVDVFLIGSELDKEGITFIDDEPFLIVNQDGVEYEYGDNDYVGFQPKFTKKPVYLMIKEHFFTFRLDDSFQQSLRPEQEIVMFLRQTINNRAFLKKLWIDQEELFNGTQLSPGYDLFYSTDHWLHLESIVDLPSENAFFKSLAKAIYQKDPALIDKSHTNTDWILWKEYDSVEFY